MAHALHREHRREPCRHIRPQYVGGRCRDRAGRTVGKDHYQKLVALPAFESSGLQQSTEEGMSRRGDPHFARKYSPKLLQSVAVPAGTGKSHLLVALGHQAIEAGFRVRYFSAVELVETLYRGLADNSVGRVLEQILKADLILIDEIGFAPMDNTGAQLFFRLVAAAYERRSLGVASHWPFEEWGRFLPDHSTAVSLLDRLLHHNVLVVTEGESFRMKEAREGRKT